MKLEEIKDFLRNKTGYQKEGGKRLRDHLNRKGFKTTTALCKQALKEIRYETGVNKLEGNITPKVLLYDIEVSYGIARAWRPGYNINLSYGDFIKHPSIICISYKFEDEEEVHNLRWDSKQDDKTLLSLFINVLNQADIIVGHNGDKFDLPWVRTRALFHGLEMRPKYKSVDTLKIARYRHRFPSNRLDDLGDYLGVGRKIKTDRQLWVDTVCNGDKEALNRMVEYCDQDVLLLEDVYKKLIVQELPSIHVGTLNGKTKQTSPYTSNANLELVKTTTSRAGTKKHLMKCLDTGKFFEMSDTDYKKFLEINN